MVSLSIHPSFFLYNRVYPAILNLIYLLPDLMAEAQAERRRSMFRIICIAIGYLFGCFQTAYLITRHKISQDIRDFGTGNVGTANVTQTLGPKAGLITLLADVLKTFVACYLCGLIFPGQPDELVVVYAGAGVALGHDFPFWLKFKGGKGVAVTIAILLLLDNHLLAISFWSVLLAFLCSKRLVMAVVALCITYPLAMFFYGYRMETVIVAGLLSCLIIVLHRSSFRKEVKVEDDYRVEYQNLGKNIAYYREQKHLDPHDLALSAKLSETVLRDLEGEEIKLAPSLDALFHLARALEIPAAALLEPMPKLPETPEAHDAEPPARQ